MHLLARKRKSADDEEHEELLIALRQAERELNVARSCFAEAVEPEIIDELIYLMQAASKKYSYFLRRVREEADKDRKAACS